MGDYLIDGEILSDIADKIRENDPDTYEGNAITPEEMPAAIDDVWQAGYSAGSGSGGTDNLATVDKIRAMHNTTGIAEVEADNKGVYWESMTNYYDSDRNLIVSTDTDQKIPIVAGENVTFESNGAVVKINATGGGSSKAIIDVTELPTENINEEAFYRVLTAKWVAHGEAYNSFTCYCVDNLPEVGEVATTDMATITTYYCVADGVVYGYVDDMLGGYFGIPSGWYPADMLFSVAGIGYGGVITDIADSSEDGDFKLLLGYALYTYKDGKWEAVKGVGSVGTGVNAEVFNGTYNQASGDYSQARGSYTKAKGYASTAEGECTVATARNQHVQGQFNIEDTEEKYAHIVGNGFDGSPSNAHTIDWQGNGWFAGTIKVGGTGQDDENAKELATKEYVDSKIGGSADDNSTIGTWVFNEVPSFDSVVYGVPYSFNFTSLGTEETLVSIVFENSKYGASGNFLTYDFINNDGSGGSYTAYSSVPVVWLKGGWDNESYRTITIQDELEDGWFKTWLKANAKKQTETSKPCLEMPQIRFTSVVSNRGQDDDSKGITGVNMICDDDYPLYFNVEIVGGGALQEGDTLQLCTRRGFMGSEANGYRAKYKLRKFAEYEITYEDLNKRYLTVATHLAGDSVPKELYHDGNAGSGNTLSPIYIRIRRPKGNMQNNDSGKTVDASFSNIVTVWKLHYREAREIKIL